jgi:hypothetical protein
LSEVCQAVEVLDCADAILYEVEIAQEGEVVEPLYVFNLVEGKVERCESCKGFETSDRGDEVVIEVELYEGGGECRRDRDGLDAVLAEAETLGGVSVTGRIVGVRSCNTLTCLKRSNRRDDMSDILQCTSSISSSSSGVSSSRSSSAASCSGGGPSLSEFSGSLSIRAWGSRGSSVRASLSTRSLPSQPLLSRGLLSSLSLSRASNAPAVAGSCAVCAAAFGALIVRVVQCQSAASGGV